MFDAKKAREITDKNRSIYIDDITEIVINSIKETAEKGRNYLYIDKKFQDNGYNYSDFRFVEKDISKTLEKLGFEIEEKRQDILTYYYVISW